MNSGPETGNPDNIGADPSTGASGGPAATGAGATSNDSRTKLEYLRPTIEKAAADAHVPFDAVAAIVLQESRGWSVQDMASKNYLAQCGQSEFDQERERHPDQFPPGLDWRSPEGQIRAVAFRLADNAGHGWEHAAAAYNGGEEANQGLTGENYHLNAPDYIDNFRMFRAAVQGGGNIPS